MEGDEVYPTRAQGKRLSVDNSVFSHFAIVLLKGKHSDPFLLGCRCHLVHIIASNTDDEPTTAQSKYVSYPNMLSFTSRNESKILMHSSNPWLPLEHSMHS